MTDLLEARVALLEALAARDYRFVTPTPATHARVIARRSAARDLRDVLGWSLPFEPGVIASEIVDLLAAADTLEESGGMMRSRLRVSSRGNRLFLHSAFPTTQQDAVFFGPDSYRFADFIHAHLPRFGPISRLADIGCGSGIGGVAARDVAEVQRLISTDVNESAIALARANQLFNATAQMAEEGCISEFHTTSGVDGVEGPIHAIIANPPYIADPAHRAYRDGGAMHGAQVSLAWARIAAERLSRGGVLLLYTGSAIVNGEDRLKAALHDVLSEFHIWYLELDPDVFGEELEREDYADVERIAVVGLVAVKR